MNRSTFQPFNLSTRHPLKTLLSTFQLFNLSTLAEVVVAALCAATAAAAAVPADTELTLGEVGLPVWMPAYGTAYRQPSAVYPISAAQAPTDDGHRVTSVSGKDASLKWELAAWAVGRTLSEQPPDVKLGDCCSAIPFDPAAVDWDRTMAANAAAVSSGRVLFDMGAENPRERLIFTASGATEVMWVSASGETVKMVYAVGSSSSARPYRIFATRVDEANSAAFIDLSGKFVSFFGDPNLLRREYNVRAEGVSNVVYGIDYDPSNTKLLTVRYTVDEETGKIHCPQGQLVMAYYDTETKDHMVAHIVVEICPPNVTTLNAEVGQCLRPAGGGYGETEKLYCVAAAGLAGDDNDPFAPYLEQYTAAAGEESTDPDHGKMFAIVPTDVTTSQSGMAMPWKADIYWQTEDPMKTRWTFEHDWYLVSWPADPLRVVVAPAGAQAGCPVVVPTNYVVKTGFKMPADVSAVPDDNTGELALNGADRGKVLVKLINANGKGCPSYLPIELTDYRRPEVASPRLFEWSVGLELSPRIGPEAGPEARAMSERVDDKLPGYIYEPESPARNWNPRLYHKPGGNLALGAVDVPTADELQDEAVNGSDDDPFASLQSAIYPVNEVRDAKIQVWWRANFQTPQMVNPVTYPALVQNYNVTWDMTMLDGFLPAIALSSQLGSADPEMTAWAGRSLLLVESNSTAAVDLGGQRLGTNAPSAAVAFACYVSPDGDTTPGRLAGWRFGGDGAEDAVSIEAVLEQGADNGFRVVFTARGGGVATNETYAVEPGRWTEVSMEVPAAAFGQDATISYGATDASAGDSATFVLLDDLGLYYFDATNVLGSLYAFDFGDDDLHTVERLSVERLKGDEENLSTSQLSNLSTGGGGASVRTAADEDGNVLTCRNCSVANAGASRDFELVLPPGSEPAPEIYYQNDPAETGYNPNEEHAFVDSGPNGYVVWALRNDLNTERTSKPVVMVMYGKNGKGRMQAFAVETNSVAHPRMESEAVVGNMLLPPAPVGRLAGSQTDIDATSSAFGFEDNAVAYRDRKNGLWARRDGIAYAKYGYPMQSGFFFPSLDEQPAVGTPIAWLACRGIPNPTLAQITNTANAVNWKWTANWPENVPELKIGQVLTKAALGLPEMWNAASMAVCYPNPSPSNVAAGASSGATVVELIDPTVKQTSATPLPVKASFPDEYGFILGPSGTTFLRKGKYYFTGLPPSISDRFYVTVEDGGILAPGLNARMNLVGQYVEKESGGSYLELNVLTAEERDAIKKLCKLDPAQRKADVDNWNAAADALAAEEVKPSPRTNSGKPVKTENSKEMILAFPSWSLYEQWLGKIANDESPLAADRFVVDKYAFSELGTQWTVVAGKEVPGSNLVFATWTTTATNQHLVGTTRRAAAKKLYESAGLNTYLGKEWDDVSPSKYSCWITYVRGKFTWTGEERPAANTYRPRDHYALVADGTGTGYVTLIENDNPDPTQVSEGLPVQMHVIKVVPELYADGIAVLSDPLNKLSEKLTLLYRTPLGSTADKYEFQWCYTTPATDGTVPGKGTDAWKDKAMDTGLVSVQLGLNGANLQDYVNTYYTLRYRPVRDSATWNLLAAAHPDWTDADFWSPWADEQLAEGWLQRVLNSLTPFAQRVEDFYNERSDMGFSMLEQIGAPYQGDVALNNDNLSEVGLLELYQTVFNRAESLLIAAGGNNIDMSKQLILAQTRMGEFYTLLGSEAYSDAKNPLIPAGAGGEPFASGTFSFANQVPSLLDEELALLRGRTKATAFPRMTEAPLYNRLAWNLTKGITEGEPAYVANYGIRARDGILDVNCAAAQYPQGHGDAWGHYLSAISGYYRLLRNPYFDWAAAMGEMLMDQKLVNVDYQDEQKFADAAVRLVQTGEDAMDLTLRKAWKENGGDMAAAYFDADPEQAFGYGEWATRTGLAAAYNWMAANALLPTNGAPYEAFTDKGVSKITRETATQLPVLASAVRSVQRKLRGVESGANPLGLSENAIPFDIDPDQLAAKNSHFEQILARAEKALDNCRTVLAYANVYGSRLAQVAQAEEDALADAATQEQAFNNQLIAIYGTPYAGDIGPGGTYPQGYDGPDLYNYTYMDLAPYGLLEAPETRFTNSYKLVQAGLYGWEYQHGRDWEGDILEDKYEEIPVNYIVNEGGIRLKPATVTGARRSEGTIQAAYRNYLKAYLKVQETIGDYDVKMTVLKATWNSVREQMIRFSVNTPVTLGAQIFKEGVCYTGTEDLLVDGGKFVIDAMKFDKDMLAYCVPAVQGTGLTVTVDPRAMAQAVSASPQGTAFHTLMGQIYTALATRYAKKLKASYADLITGLSDAVQGALDLFRKLETTMETAAMDVNLAAAAIQPAFADLAAAEAAYRAEVEKGEQLQEQRALWRQQVSNRATEQRYLDMYNRVQRNIALTKYSTAFDTAQRYVWELAKVYDYETGLLSSDPQAGKQFLADIVATRSLGQEGVSITSATTDGGLYDVVNRMKANWDVLKPRLGINNPDKPAKWFSLRRELFRIKEGAEGDAAWRKELEKHRVDNILANTDFLRHCQPPASENALVFSEPGYIIPFSTSINNAENFFGKTLQFGDHQFSSSDYATKIDAVGVDLVGLDQLEGGAGVEPNIYLVPVGTDYMRSPAGTERALLGWNVVDQVLPLPYTVGSGELDAQDWIATFSGLDGTSDSTATIRRHSTLRAGSDFKSTRLVGRSAWNDRWLLVIPASAIDADRDKAMDLLESSVKDIRLGIRAYARQGN